jgi:Carboxypeptidase regulatory-like domain
VKTILLLLLVSTSVCSLVFAQSKVAALVEVKDESGAAVGGAEVSVAATTSSETPKIVLQTNSNGMASLDLLPGTYDLSVKSQGFKAVNRRVLITDAERPTFAVMLQVGSCPPGPCLDVLPGPEQVATEQSELPTVINDERTHTARRLSRCLYLWRCSGR